jgi:hypothetical protein
VCLSDVISGLTCGDQRRLAAISTAFPFNLTGDVISGLTCGDQRRLAAISTAFPFNLTGDEKNKISHIDLSSLSLWPNSCFHHKEYFFPMNFQYIIINTLGSQMKFNEK